MRVAVNDVELSEIDFYSICFTISYNAHLLLYLT